MKMKFIFLFACVFPLSEVLAQQAAYFDPAQAYNRLLLEKNNSAYTRVGRYKVIGSPFLFGEKHVANMFAKGETALNIRVSYNAYTQQVEFYSTANPVTALMKEPQEVDSFELRDIDHMAFGESLKFINGSHLGQSGKQFYQVVATGNAFALYKKYTASLEIVSTNYVDAELRQFEINYEYYYFNQQTREFKKLKLSQNGIKKEFRDSPGIDEILSDNNFSYNPEKKLKQIFASLNNN